MCALQRGAADAVANFVAAREQNETLLRGSRLGRYRRKRRCGIQLVTFAIAKGDIEADPIVESGDAPWCKIAELGERGRLELKKRARMR